MMMLYEHASLYCLHDALVGGWLGLSPSKQNNFLAHWQYMVAAWDVYLWGLNQVE